MYHLMTAEQLFLHVMWWFMLIKHFCWKHLADPLYCFRTVNTGLFWRMNNPTGKCISKANLQSGRRCREGQRLVSSGCWALTVRSNHCSALLMVRKKWTQPAGQSLSALLKSKNSSWPDRDLSLPQTMLNTCLIVESLVCRSNMYNCITFKHVLNYLGNISH